MLSSTNVKISHPLNNGEGMSNGEFSEIIGGSNERASDDLSTLTSGENEHDAHAKKTATQTYSLVVNITDALSEREKVKYTVQAKTNSPEFTKTEMSVVREHDEFIWLHNCLEDNEDYAGFIIPPAPPRPDFDASREKLQKLGEGESTMTKDEFLKIKQELEQEYLATFKKTVALHEMFLCRLASHLVFQKDQNFRVFLEYENELSVRSRNKKELVGSIFKRFTQTADEVFLSGQKDIDDFFEHEKNYLVEYHTHIKEATARADKVCRIRQNVADTYARISHGLEKLGQLEAASGEKEFGQFLGKVTASFEKLKKAEARVGTDEELKEVDTLRYFLWETQAAKNLLYRRTRCLANYEAANKNLERSRARNRDIPKAESEQAESCKKFEDISKLARRELVNLNNTRIAAFKKSLSELAELEVKQSKAKIAILQSSIAALTVMPEQNN
ncbi:hypothetical protein GPALN_012736 [Globodera pallida]|nr:hypothetical protein GPALN_012736 [Globodera pallida]